jgi:hypothetical protein
MKGSESVVWIFDFANNNRFPVQLLVPVTIRSKELLGFMKETDIFWVVI